MRIASALPFIIPLVLAHTEMGLPASHKRRFSGGQLPAPVAREAMVEKRGILDGLVDPNENDDTTAIATSTTPVTSPAVTTGKPPIVTSASGTTRPSSGTITSPVSVPSGLNSSGISSNISDTATGSLSRNVTSTLNVTSTSTSSSSSSASDQSIGTSVDASGSTLFVTKTYTPSTSSTPTSSATSIANSTPSGSTEGGGISTGAIIGISVAVGLVVLSLIGCAIWRMKRKNGDEDEAIRWPELNRHGDSSVHHALPARQTGQHGIETSPLERSLSNSSSIFANNNNNLPTHSAHSAHAVAPAMALNGSAFGAASSLDLNDYYDEKTRGGGSAGYYGDHQNSYPGAITAGAGVGGGGTGSTGYDMDDYTSYPPAMQVPSGNPGQGAGGTGYDSGSDENGGHGRNMTVVNPDGHGHGHVTYR